MGYLTDLTDEQWAWIEPIFPPQEGSGTQLSENYYAVRL
jgi:transposase